MADKRDWGLLLAAGTTLVGIAVSCTNLDNKLDRLSDDFAKLEEKQAEPLCLTVLNTQVKALETGKMEKVKADLDRLSRQFCPTPPSNMMPASLGTEQTPEQKRRELAKANDELADIIDALGGDRWEEMQRTLPRGR